MSNAKWSVGCWTASEGEAVAEPEHYKLIS